MDFNPFKKSYQPDKPDVTPIERVKARVSGLEAKMKAREEVELADNASFSSDIAELKELILALTAKFDASQLTTSRSGNNACSDESKNNAAVSVIKPPPSKNPPANEKNTVSRPPAIISDQVDSRRIELPYQGKRFDNNGLIYFVGSQGKTAAYANPHNVHENGMFATMSSVDDEFSCYGCTASRFLNHHNDQEDNYTGEFSGSWMKVDIGVGRRMVVNHYCLRHGLGGTLHAPIMWKLQGSQTGDGWVTLIEHKFDHSLVRDVPESFGFATADWAIDVTPEAKRGFRYFRIIQTGLNYNHFQFPYEGGGNIKAWDKMNLPDRRRKLVEGNILCCSGIELYGVLFTRQHPF